MTKKNVACIEAEGEEKDLEIFIKFTSKGSPLSVIKKVVIEEGALNNFTSFDIVHTNVKSNLETV